MQQLGWLFAYVYYYCVILILQFLKCYVVLLSMMMSLFLTISSAVIWKVFPCVITRVFTRWYSYVHGRQWCAYCHCVCVNVNRFQLNIIFVYYCCTYDSCRVSEVLISFELRIFKGDLSIHEYFLSCNIDSCPDEVHPPCRWSS